MTESELLELQELEELDALEAKYGQVAPTQQVAPEPQRMHFRTEQNGDESVYLSGNWRPFKDGNAYNSRDNSWTPVGDDRPQKPEEEGYFSQMAGNVIPSGVRLAQDLSQPILHPIDTAKGITNITQGALSNALDLGWEEEAQADAVVDYYTDRYSNPLDTLRDDPVGALSDISMLTGVGLGKLTGKVGNFGRKVGALDPSQAIVNTGIKAGSVAAKYLNNRLSLGLEPRALLEGSLKFGTTLKDTSKIQRNKMYDTILDEQILPDTKGIEKLELVKDGLNNQIDELIENVPIHQNMTSRANIAGTRQKIIDEFAVGTLNEVKNAKHINKIYDDYGLTLNMFDEYGELIPDSLPDMITPKQLQNSKKNAYRDIKFDAKNMNTGTAAQDAAKRELANQMMTRIEEFSPEIHDKNRRLGDLIEITKPFNRASMRIGNHNIMGLGLPNKMTAAAMIGSGVGEAATVAGGLLGAAFGLTDVAMNKSKIALKAHQLGKRKYIDQLIESNTSKGYISRELMNVLGDQREKGLMLQSP